MANASPLPLIRRATTTDRDVIAEYNIRMAWETESLRLNRETALAGVAAALSDERHGRYYVAEREDRVVGQLLVTYEWSDWLNGLRWWVQSVYVHPDYRRQGVFRGLLERVLEAATQEGVVAVRLYVEERNEVAQEVYRRLGFGSTGYLVLERSVAGE